MNASLAIDRAAHDGRGVAREDGKVVFVTGALPGERVSVTARKRRRGVEEAEVASVLEPSARRVTPACAHFGVCGGCALQHAEPSLQLEIKRQALADNLARIGRVEPARWLEPVTGPIWGYRRRARLSVKFVIRKGRVLVGFRERGKPRVADLARCEVLAPPLDGMIAELARTIGGLTIAKAIPQVEVAVGENATVLVLRHLDPVGDDDRTRLRAFADRHSVSIELQSGGYDSIEPLDAPAVDLTYSLPAHDIVLGFAPTDFVQVNSEVNRRLVDLAVNLLEPGPEDGLLDLFCGLGNFTLPLARRARRVTGVEGDPGLVARARDNAARNAIGNADFEVADLAERLPAVPWVERTYDKVLLDPPRAGARAVVERIPEWRPTRVVYVSCHPGTLARDADTMVNTHGYRLAATGVVDMFPHTAHVESIALFERDGT